MAATVLELEDALREYASVLIDTSVLITGFKAKRDGRHSRFPHAIPMAYRRTSTVSLTEFLRAPNMLRNELRGRRDWLDDTGIRCEHFNRAASDALTSLLARSQVPPDTVDTLLAAHSIARRVPFLTENVKDFDEVDGLILLDAR